MAANKDASPAPEPLPQPSYPSIEAFVEGGDTALVEATFADLRVQLAALKGPRLEQGKKVDKAIARTQELLQYLLQVREKIEADRKTKGGGRK